jgi:hypothetical protein
MHEEICALTSSSWYKVLTNMSEINLSWKENLKDNEVGHCNSPVAGRKQLAFIISWAVCLKLYS